MSKIHDCSLIDTATHWDDAPEIIAVSASDRQALAGKLSRLSKAFLNGTPLADVAGESRRTFEPQMPCRLAMTMENEVEMQQIDGVVTALMADPPTDVESGAIWFGENPAPGRLAFVFPGQGSQYVMMGSDLVTAFPEARQMIAAAESAFGKDASLIQLMYPPETADQAEQTAQEESLRSTDAAQPAIGAVSLAMARILARFDIVPDGTCGHSYGELTALCVSGRITREAFLDLSAARGKFMAQAGKSGEKGGMMAIRAPMDKIESIISENKLDVVLANRNSPDQGVVSGPVTEIEKMKTVCRENRVVASILPVSAAFHSRLVQDAATPFKELLARVEFHASKTAVYSNTTARPYPNDPQSTAKQLGEHLLNPVRFAEEIQSMHEDGFKTFVEVGPKAVLTGLVKAILKSRTVDAVALDAAAGRRPGMWDLARLLCFLASRGYPVALHKWRR